MGKVLYSSDKLYPNRHVTSVKPKKHGLALAKRQMIREKVETARYDGHDEADDMDLADHYPGLELIHGKYLDFMVENKGSDTPCDFVLGGDAHSEGLIHLVHDTLQKAIKRRRENNAFGRTSAVWAATAIGDPKFHLKDFEEVQWNHIHFCRNATEM